MLFFLRTSWTIFVVAIVINEVVGEPFHNRRFPHTNAIAAFQAKTAQGKLNAVIIPTTPIGFQTYIIMWFGLSDGRISPPICLDRPQAKSQISIASWTSPSP